MVVIVARDVGTTGFGLMSKYYELEPFFPMFTYLRVGMI
jgi:hypothetical protein